MTDFRKTVETGVDPRLDFIIFCLNQGIDFIDFCLKQGIFPWMINNLCVCSTN